MSDSSDVVTPRPGLRERKKARTRATIRREAFRLFREQGYADTTIEQIADAADISPSTVFRYFPTKEALVIADDLDPPVIEAFDSQPKEMPLFEALRAAVDSVNVELTEADIEFERERQRLMFEEPELRRAVLMQMLDSIDMLAYLVARRTGRDVHDFEVRALAGALMGAVLGVATETPGDMELATRAMRYVEDGLPLGHRPGHA